MEKKLFDQAEEVKSLFRSIGKNFRCYMAKQIYKYDFTVPQLMLLQELYTSPGITVKELSERLGQAKSTVSGIVDRLEAQNAVTRSRDKDDRRVVKLYLTPAILELKDSMNFLKKNYLANILREASPEEIRQILIGLQLLNELTKAH